MHPLLPCLREFSFVYLTPLLSSGVILFKTKAHDYKCIESNLRNQDQLSHKYNFCTTHICVKMQNDTKERYWK